MHLTHKVVGIYYIKLVVIFASFAIMTSLIIRIECHTTGNNIITLENISYYNLILSLHGVLMLLVILQPLLFGGFSNYFIPILVLREELSYHRLNVLALLLLPLAYFLLALSIVCEYSNNYAGWTLYPPLSTISYSNLLSMDLIIFSIAILGFSSLFGSINFLNTIFLFSNVPLYLLSLFAYSIIITSFLLILTLPVVTAGLILLFLDMHFNSIFFDPFYSGDPVLYQHLFWFFGHPEVYVLILPSFGIISEVLLIHLAKPVFSSVTLTLAMFSIAILGCLVWAHHMYTVGLDSDTRAYFTAVTIMISIPTGTKMFNYLSSLIYGFSRYNPSLVLILAFIFIFILGGITGVILGNAFLDISLHDTIYVIAHFHIILSVSASIAAILGFINFHSLMFRTLPNTLITPLIINFIIGVLMIFIPLQVLGFNLMPRRIPEYPDDFIPYNYIASIFSVFNVLNILLY